MWLAKVSGARQASLTTMPSSSFSSRMSVSSGRSPCLDLAAGKLPQARHRPAGGAFGDQHAPVGIDEGAGGDNEKLHAYDPSTRKLGARG